MAILKNHYNNNLRSLIISKHNFSNNFFIPRIKSISLKLKSEINDNSKIWALLFWSVFLLTGQRPHIRKKKESSFFIDTRYYYVFKSTMSKKNLFNFLVKYIYFLLPKMESLETFTFKNNKNKNTLSVRGYMNYFESIEIFNFLGDSELYMMNHLKFETIIITTSKHKLYNVTLLRSFQIPIS